MPKKLCMKTDIEEKEMLLFPNILDSLHIIIIFAATIQDFIFSLML